MRLALTPSYAFEKQPELAGTQSELACMGSAFSYDCDQSSSA